MATHKEKAQAKKKAKAAGALGLGLISTLFGSSFSSAPAHTLFDVLYFVPMRIAC